jgi:hypothetical protein
LGEYKEKPKMNKEKFDYLMKQFEASKSLTVGKYADNMEKDLEDFRATYVK